MTAEPVASVLTDDFLTAARQALDAEGFVSDEHAFAPYRETVSTHVGAIQQALVARGFRGQLMPGYVNHPQAGYAYFIYDADRFASSQEANQAVHAWLSQRYGD